MLLIKSHTRTRAHIHKKNTIARTILSHPHILSLARTHSRCTYTTTHLHACIYTPRE